MNYNWEYINDICEVEPCVTGIHCDTRDFHVLYEEQEYTIGDNIEVYQLLHGCKINEKFLIHKDEIIPWLKHIETISGGRAGWRCLNFTHIKTKLGWLKYIRFYRYAEHSFVVCDSYSTPIYWRACNEETLEKEYLNAH